MAAIANLILNLLIVALLAVTIAYCWLLNRRIKVLQDSKSELAQLLSHFDESTERASESIIALQTASKKIGENIQHRIEKANYVLDDLSFMIEKGGKLTDQLEASFAVNRARTRVMAEEPLSSVPELMQSPPASEPSSKPASKERSTASLEAVLERIVGRNKAAKHADVEEEDVSTIRGGRSVPPKARSKTEQELLDMIKAGIKG